MSLCSNRFLPARTCHHVQISDSGIPGVQAEVSLAQFIDSPAPQWVTLERPRGSIAEKGQSCGQICVALWHGPELEPQPQGAEAFCQT
jgi:hypothetical protein